MFNKLEISEEILKKI